MYQLIYEFIIEDLLGNITLPVFDGWDISIYSQYLGHAFTIISMVLLYWLCIKFIVWVSGLFGRLWR